MTKKFFNPNTKFDPEYRSAQKVLWQLLTNEQQKVVAMIFCHLKNHAQIEIAEALIDFIRFDIYPDPRDWSCSFMELVFVQVANHLNLIHKS